VGERPEPATLARVEATLASGRRRRRARRLVEWGARWALARALRVIAPVTLRIRGVLGIPRRDPLA
jgi:hypothetical protein